MKTYQLTHYHAVMTRILVVLLGIGLLWAFQMPVLAQDVKTLAKDANKALRNSQRAMFSGKFEESQAELKKAADLIEQIKAADPNFSKLKSLEGKYKKQEADLAKRLPKETPTTTDPGTQQEQPAAQPDKLPRAVISRLKKIDMAVKRGTQVLEKDVADDWKMKTGEMNGGHFYLIFEKCPRGLPPI